MSEFIHIVVSDAVKAIVNAKAKDLCKERGMKLDSFNQDACAMVCLRSLKRVEAMVDEEEEANADAKKDSSFWLDRRAQLKLQAAKVCANASALRQAISQTKAARAEAQIDVSGYANLIEV